MNMATSKNKPCRLQETILVKFTRTKEEVAMAQKKEKKSFP